jgi:hypothetical protein
MNNNASCTANNDVASETVSKDLCACDEVETDEPQILTA